MQRRSTRPHGRRGRLRASLAAVVVLLLTALGACSRFDRVRYSRFVNLNPSGWEATEQCVFDLADDSAAFSDPAARYDMIVTVRHTTAFPYNNLWLKFEELTRADTIVTTRQELSLTSPSGSWRGKGVQGIYEFSDTIRHGIMLFPGYTLSITHDMPARTVPGLLDIGLTIERCN